MMGPLICIERRARKSGDAGTRKNSTRFWRHANQVDELGIVLEVDGDSVTREQVAQTFRGARHDSKEYS